MKRPTSPSKRTLRRVRLGLAIAALAALTVLAQNPEAAPALPTPPDEGNLRAFIELARSDIQTEKATIIAQNIKFTEAEAAEFWPLHREYTLELNTLLDQRLQLINDYLGTFDSMTDKQATTLAKKVFDLEAKRVDLKRTYFKRFSKVISAKKAAQFFQLENQLNAALDLRLAASLPLIK
jgi:hypothetical protein